MQLNRLIRSVPVALLVVAAPVLWAAAAPEGNVRPAIDTAGEEQASADVASATLDQVGRHASALVRLSRKPGMTAAGTARALARAKALESKLIQLAGNREELLDWQIEALDRVAPLASQLRTEVEIAADPQSPLRSDAWENMETLARRMAQFAGAYAELGSALEKLNRLDEETADFEGQSEAIAVAKR